ncbi:MAG: hypothetical protein N2483_08425, partial [Burkholderiaceae bacterium]|nr:hypothetical protein [Burkholderiaceae bacterium]
MRPVADTDPLPPRLLDKLRERIRDRCYSLGTGQACVYRARSFIHFSGPGYPRDMAAAEVEAFLPRLAAQRNVSAPADRQVPCGRLLPQRRELGQDWPWLQSRRRRQALTQVAAVLSRDEETRPLQKSGPRHGPRLGLQLGAGLSLVAWELPGLLDRLTPCASIVPGPPAALRRGLP